MFLFSIITRLLYSLSRLLSRMVVNTIDKALVKKYFSITGEALEKVQKAMISQDDSRRALADDFLDMASRYYNDAEHFFEKGEWVLAYAALNYAHGWLDAGARSGLFLVKDSRLFTVDDE